MKVITMKKILSCLMAILICFSVFPITAFANDANLEAKATSEELVVYETGYETDIYTDYWQPGMFENDEIEAALNVRDNMVDRNKEFTIVLTTDMEPDFFSDIVKDLVMLATDEELAEKPIHGDYLRYQFEQYKCTGDVNYDGYYYTYYIDFDFKYYTTYEQEQQMNAKVSELMLSIVNADDSEYAKVKKIYDYICDNVTYDYTNLNNEDYKLKYTAYAALFNKTAVCQGYTTLFYRLAREAGLNARIVSNDNHSWNIVQIGDLYYNLDVTFDANVKQAGSEYMWFLRNVENFEHAEHIRDNSFDERFEEEHPMSETDYDPSNDVVDTHRHTLITIDAKSATCDADGYTGELICSECKEVLRKGTIIPATGNHTWDDGVVTTEPTCTDTGSIVYTCTVCGVTQNESIPAIGHTYETTTANATLNQNGSVVTKCSVCGDVSNSTTIYYPKTIELNQNAFTVNGGVQKPTVIVKDANGTALILNRDYTVNYSNANSTNAGEYTVTINFQGNYSGTKTLTYQIAEKPANKWIKSGDRWWYRHADGSYTKNGWEKINNKWYHFDSAGWMQTGWLKVSGKWYYLNASGDMATGWKKVSNTWYYLNSSGAMLTGWQYINGAWYYMNSSGAMLTGWQKIGGDWYYMNSSGAMCSNQWIGNYYVNSSGRWVKTR